MSNTILVGNHLACCRYKVSCIKLRFRNRASITLSFNETRKMELNIQSEASNCQYQSPCK
jgi:hypothetical protein